MEQIITDINLTIDRIMERLDNIENRIDSVIDRLNDISSENSMTTYDGPR
jgi:archaellum component FlaC